MNSLITLQLLWLLLDKRLVFTSHTFWPQWCWREKS